MRLSFYYPRWGSENVDWESFCQKVKQAGYDGIEAALPSDTAEQKLIFQALKNNDLKLIGQYYQSFEKDFDLHKANYIKELRILVSAQPVKINAQTGKDYFSFEQNSDLFATADSITRETGIVICHETHRNKALFAAHIAYDFLKKLPNLKITADFSHWCTVAESLLEDQQEAVALACQHVEHIHSRVGHAQSAQIIDPRLAEFATELEAHLRWWDAIIKQAEDTQKEVLTITTEFGPAPYMIHLPFTNTPVADQWDINCHMMQLLKKRYSK